MNLSKIAIESVQLSIEEPVDRLPELREKEAELIRIIEAIRQVNGSEAWSYLKQHIFDGLTGNLESSIIRESKKEDINSSKISSLSGQLRWAERYSDLSKLEASYKLELVHIRNTLKTYGKTKS